MTTSVLIARLVSLFDTTPELKAMCPKGLYWRRGLPSATVAATGTAVLEKVTADNQFNTGTDHPSEIVFNISAWFSDDSSAFRFVELIHTTYTTLEIPDTTILLTDDDVFDDTDQTWRGMVELTITAEMNG